MPSLTHNQLSSLETTERIASCFSLVGTIFIFITFVSSPNFRRPINRLVFYASWGNTLCNVATLMSESPIRLGQHSHLCQFQGFLIQMFVPADALWNLAMAINVYLTLFKKYNAHALKAQEWKYFLLCYGCTFLIAFALIFVDNPSRGKAYGSAVLWCWISDDWDFLRLALCYGPAWICILIALSIYTMAGRFIFRKRHDLRAFNIPVEELPLSYPPTAFDPPPAPTSIKVTREFASLPSENVPGGLEPDTYLAPTGNNKDGRGVNGNGRFSELSTSSTSKSYSVAVTTESPSFSSRPGLPHIKSSSSSTGGPGGRHHNRQPNRAAMEANRAAYSYTFIASLFFVSLLVTWVPSSINRVYSLIHPEAVSEEYAYAAGVVLSLMGMV
ncbi:hypothetical protein JMJ35_007272 [Cladonia borealis]|uniref:G-protein coupled receptors family 2 profile 2 domain-containing protein n=1 Tax=Cladonia borealis TaxID=184061 RepID=A0AA39UZF5_9LECA|nr:hypothetical protein JMJ35_007272 [Cladonia borealis]